MTPRGAGYYPSAPGRIPLRAPVPAFPRRPQGRRPPNRPAQIGCLVVICAVLLLAILGVIGSHLPNPPQPAKNGGKGPSQYVVSGRDPKAFADAAAMFALPSQKRLDDLTARTTLTDLEASFKAGDPWPVHLWTQLDRLRGVGGSAQVVEALRHTALKMEVPDRIPSRSKAVAAMQAFAQGNTHYQAGRFNQAIESYRAALKSNPAYWDAWNNMALAEMHSHNDLVALFVLAALTKNNPAYAGAALNLSVCLERLGQDATAYEITSAVAKEYPQMPMAAYNLAWFENLRGQYEPARTHLSQALQRVSDYAVAKWLQTINSLESGRYEFAGDLAALPRADPSQGAPRIVIRPVKVAAVDAYSGNALVAKIPKGSPLTMSEKAGDWYAFYWPVDNVKRRLWTQQSGLGNRIGNNNNVVGLATLCLVLSAIIIGAVVRRRSRTPTPSAKNGGKGSVLHVVPGRVPASPVAATAFAPPSQKPPAGPTAKPALAGFATSSNVQPRLGTQPTSPGDSTGAAGNDLKVFLGTWSEKWADVSNKANIRIEESTGRPKVTMDRWRVWDERVENGILSFRKKGGGRNWEFVYTVTPRQGKMVLDVFRVHDQRRFTGELTR